MTKRKLRKVPTGSQKKAKKKAEPKVELTELQEAFKEMEEGIKDKVKREIKSCMKDKSIMSMLLENQSDHLTRFNTKVYKLFDMKTKRLTASLDKITDINQVIEETLTNVLLAIRQNEYLQAWYPEQHGYPEMKVVGTHPSNIERTQENAND